MIERPNRWWHAARARLRSLRGRRALDREFAEEARFHMEQEAARLRRNGLTEREAELAARKAFGNPRRVAEAHRAAREYLWATTQLDDIRAGLRQFRRRPAASFVAVVLLALGIGAVTTVYSVGKALLLEPLPFHDLDRVVAMGATEPGASLNGEGWMHPAELQAIRAGTMFESIAPLQRWFGVLLSNDRSTEFIGYRSAPELFRVLGTVPALGRPFAAGADEIVLSHRFWARWYGADPGVLGHRVSVGDRRWTIVGVMPPGAIYPMGTDLWAALDAEPAMPSDFSGRRIAVLARLPQDRSLTEVNAFLAATAERLDAERPEGDPEPLLRAESLIETITYGARPLVVILASAALVMMALVCASVAGMLLVRGAMRHQEIAIRSVLGASRWRLVRQLLSEGLFLAFMAAGLGVMLASLATSGLRASIQGQWWRFFFAGVDGIRVDASALGAAVFVAIGASALFGIAPALRAARADLTRPLRAGPRPVASGWGLRAIVALEIALTCMLLAGTLALTDAARGIGTESLGFDTEVVATRARPHDAGLRAGPDHSALADLALARLRAAGATHAALSTSVPAVGGSRVVDAASTSGIETRAGVLGVSSDYFATLGVQVLSGAPVSADSADVDVVVSATLARRLWPGESALGQTLRLDDATVRVIGVAADVARSWNDPTPAALVYRRFDAGEARALWLLIRWPGQPPTRVAESLEGIRGFGQSFALDEARPLARALEERAAPGRIVSGLLAYLALTAVLVSLAGMYAVVREATMARRHELGVRVAVGATRQSLVVLLGTQSAMMTLLGMAVGVPGAILLLRGLRMPPLDRFLAGGESAVGWVALSIAGLALASLVAGLRPALVAAHADPVQSLRGE